MSRLRFLPALLLAAALSSLTVVAGCSGPQQTTMSGDDDMAGDGEMSTARMIRKAEYDIENLQFPELPDFQVPAVEEMTLRNGMKVFLIEDRALPTISARARIGVGSVWEPADHAGLASMTGTVMRTGGTQSMSSDEINQLLENLGASVETYVGETYGGASMNTLADNVGQVLPVFVDVLAEPAFAQDKVEQAKSQTRTVISRRNDQPSQIVSREFSDLVYGEDSPYAREPEYYTVDEVSREDMVAFHGEYFHPNNTILSVWGDFDAEEMKQTLRDAFAEWERADGFTPPEPPEPEGERDYSVNLVEKDDVNQSTVRMGYLGELTRDDPDYFPAIVMNEVLSGGFTSRLFKNVRTDQGLAYSVFGQYLAGYRTPGPFLAQVITKSGSTVEGAQSVMNEIERMRQAPPTEEEVQLAKDSYLNSFVFNFDTRSEILGRLMTYEKYGYPRDFLEQTRRGVSNVTPDDVYRVSQELLHPDAMDVLVLGNSEDFDAPLSTLARGGEVNVLDISIPTSAPGEEEDAPAMTEEDMAAGRNLLGEVREAMGGDAYDDLTNMRQTVEVTQQTPQGPQTREITLGADLSGSDRVRIDLPTQMGQIPIIRNDGQIYVKTPGGVQPAPPQIQQVISGALGSDPTYLMTRADDLGAARQEPVTVDGVEYPALRITPPEGEPLTFLIDPSTMLPAEVRQRTVVPGQGPVDSRSVLSDYQEADGGVMVPMQSVTYQNGEEANSSAVTSFETNVDFPATYFAVDQ